MNTYRLSKRLEFLVWTIQISWNKMRSALFCLGITSIAYRDGPMQVMNASLLGPGDCVMVISNSGRTPDLIDAAGIEPRNSNAITVITVSGSP